MDALQKWLEKTQSSSYSFYNTRSKVPLGYMFWNISIAWGKNQNSLKWTAGSFFICFLLTPVLSIKYSLFAFNIQIRCLLSNFSFVWLFVTLEILQARMLEWVATSSSMGSSWPRNWTCISYVSSIGFFTTSTTWKVSIPDFKTCPFLLPSCALYLLLCIYLKHFLTLLTLLLIV